ncbi:MAG: hypothetical protein KJO21_12825 [Verrucomicrobiae bacterium]|nr:hypothetical protein [Verrucomicrobiae bacterium]NNJ44221.1 hypothetical protein [Akkermansiaceae bacterium]
MQQPLAIFVMMLSLASSVFSQEPKKTDRTCRLVFPEKPSKSPRFVYLYDGKDNHRIYLSAVNFSDVVKLKSGDLTLVIAPEPITDPENIQPAYPKISVPKEIKNFYIFLASDEKNKVMPLQMRMINLNNGEFNLGDTLWCNFTNHSIAAKLGQSKMSVAAKKTTISKGPLPSSGHYKAEFIFQPNSTGEFRRITEQQWWFDASSRYVGFIADRGRRLPGIYFFRDFRSKG